jgi:hypothetical protein
MLTVTDPTRAGLLPLRPLTTGELLDGAFTLLRSRLRPLVGLGALLAVVEQAVLFPLRRWSDQDLSLFPATHRLSQFALLVVAAFATEAAVIAILGGVAATSAPRALLGSRAPATPPAPAGGPASAVLPVAVAAAITAAVAALTAIPFVLVLDRWQWFGFVAAGFFTMLAWPIPYGLLGLGAAVAVIERRGPLSAVWRGLRLAGRMGMRTGWIRCLGYVNWLILRVAIYGAVIGLVTLVVEPSSSTMDNLVMAAAAVLVNCLAYPALACLDVLLVLEARMRTEGLDLALRRDRSRGVSSEASLWAAR